jgi:sarcosine oxidase, subunit gamma
VSDMTPITALGGRSPRVDTHFGVTLTENTNTALASFAARLGSEKKAREVLAKALGCDLPGPGQVIFGTFDAVWMGPHQWMIVAPHDTHELLASELSDAAGVSASITEQNDAWCRFDLSGKRLVSVFELLCSVPLRDWTGGEATRTSIDHLGCFVICKDVESVTVLGPRSSAGSLHHALLTSMKAAL